MSKKCASELPVGTYILCDKHRRKAFYYTTIGIIEIDKKDGLKGVKWLVGDGKGRFSAPEFSDFKVITEEEALAWMI